jgi:hypothetical protein
VGPGKSTFAAELRGVRAPRWSISTSFTGVLTGAGDKEDKAKRLAHFVGLGTSRLVNQLTP